MNKNANRIVKHTKKRAVKSSVKQNGTRSVTKSSRSIKAFKAGVKVIRHNSTADASSLQIKL